MLALLAQYPPSKPPTFITPSPLPTLATTGANFVMVLWIIGIFLAAGLFIALALRASR